MTHRGFDRQYVLLTLAYLAMIYWLSSLPDIDPAESNPTLEFLFNLGHLPLFAGLAFCAMKSMSRPGEASWTRMAVVLVVCAACAALDEFHQSFVPGRDASVGDFLVDLAGIVGMLVFLRLYASRTQRRHAAVIAPPDPPPPVTSLRAVSHTGNRP